MRILITGGTGFIGSHLTAALARRADCKVVALGRNRRFKYDFDFPPDWEERVEICPGDINDFSLLQELVAGADVIFHKVASVGVAASGQSIRQYVQANIGGTASLAEALQKTENHVSKVVLDSSVGVYGEGIYKCARCGLVRPELRYKIDSNVMGPSFSWDPPCPSCQGAIVPMPTPENVERKGETVYGITKKAQEDLLAIACKRTGIPLTIMRCSSVYGPAQSEANYCAELMRLLAAGRQPKINEDGMQTRDYISISDVVRAQLLVLDAALDGVSIFNVVSGEEMTLLQFVTNVSRAVSSVMKIPFISPLVTGAFNPADVRHCQADGAQIQDRLGFKAETRLQDGIQALAAQLAVDMKNQVPIA